jgi:hypothetical protein
MVVLKYHNELRRISVPERQPFDVVNFGLSLQLSEQNLSQRKHK